MLINHFYVENKWFHITLMVYFWYFFISFMFFVTIFGDFGPYLLMNFSILLFWFSSLRASLLIFLSNKVVLQFIGGLGWYVENILFYISICCMDYRRLQCFGARYTTFLNFFLFSKALISRIAINTLCKGFPLFLYWYCILKIILGSFSEW